MLIWGSRIFCPAGRPGVDISTNQHDTRREAGIISTPPIAKDARDANAKLRRTDKLKVSPGGKRHMHSFESIALYGQVGRCEASPFVQAVLSTSST